MPEALITVVMPTYNRRVMLERAVDSVLQDEMAPLILHIHDNASTDGTEDYVRELMARDSRVKYNRHSQNMGSWINTCDGLKSVATKYFLILADDDWVLPNFLSNALMILEMDPDLGGAAFMAEARFASGELETTYPREKPSPGRHEPAENIRDFFLKGHYFWSSVLWRTEVLTYLGHPYLHAGLPSDIDMQAQIFCRYPIYVVDQPGAVFFRHDSQSALGFNIEHTFDWATFFRRLDKKITETGLIAPEDYYKLRRLAVDRYKIAWRNKAEACPVKDKIEMMKLYSAAAFTIGDMEFADYLINRLNAETAR